ncbi:hypothetical protein [Streptomyces sp. WAC00263]|uniref:hypothetical protein n=1 Tax=Streptomyces sp. WAC00263 TaxID=1917422 RepID=UPI0015EE51BF|nr:hypothetical protein [Streptomyces sp. WAC00263]KAF5994096.1 hypothetical protein BOG92_022245 [Streptomyces sp. WAC00263]
MIDPSGIPQFTGDFDLLDKDTSGLRGDAIGIRNGGMDVHSRFQMLEAFYTAPEADDLFATTQPVMDKADAFAAQLETVADALDTYSVEARPLAKRLAQLKTDAFAFVDSVEGDDNWTYDGDKIHRHQELMDGVAAAESAFREAERRAATKISSLVGGPEFVVDDGHHTVDKKTVMYGYGLDVLKHAKDTPWGAPESESHHAWEVGYWAKSFFWDGLVIDNIWGGVKGLGTLVGWNGSDAAGDAWGHLGDVVSGIGQYTAKPYDALMDWAIGPDKESATEVRQKKAARDFAKSMVAWDMWSENPARAAATVVFNGLTLGAGPLAVAAKGGEVGAVAKGAGIAAKVGEYIDPVAVGLKATGKAISTLPKLSDLTAGIRTGIGASADSQRIHSVIELGDGSKVVIEDGKFIPVDKHGNVVGDTPRQEAVADARATPEETPAQQREPAGVGAASRVPGATAHVGEASGRAGASHPVGPGTPRSGAGPVGNGHVGTGSGGHGSGGPDDVGRAGGDAVGGAGHAGDGAVPPAHHADEGTGNGGHGGERELTAAERKQIQDEHIRKANDPDRTWFKEHYDPLGRRRHLLNADGTTKLVDGVELPQLAKNAGGKWVAAHDLPSGPSEIKTGKTAFTSNSVNPANLPALDQTAKNRKVGMDLTTAEKAFEEHPSTATQKALDDAQNAYKQQLGDVPNNSKIGEQLGEQAARLHVIPKEFPGAAWVELPKTPNGANMFDQVYELGNDGHYLIVEAKAPKGELDWRNGAGGQAQGMRVKQGTKLYVQTILTQMWKRGGEDRRIADDLFDALEDGKLQYVLVKANENAGSYAGAVLEHFKIY